MIHGLKSIVLAAQTNRTETKQHVPAPMRLAMLPACADISASARSLFLFSLRLLSKIFSLFIEQNRPFPSFLVIIISLPSKLVKRNYLTVVCLFYERRTFSLPRKKPICTSFRNLKTKTATLRCFSLGFELKKQNRLALIKGDKKDAIRKGGILVICRILENRYNAPADANGSLERSAYRLLERQG